MFEMFSKEKKQQENIPKKNNIESLGYNIEQNKVNLINVLEMEINLHEENVKKLKQMKEKLSPTLVAIDMTKEKKYTNVALIFIGIIAIISSIISIILLFNFNKKKK